MILLIRKEINLKDSYPRGNTRSNLIKDSVKVYFDNQNYSYFRARNSSDFYFALGSTIAHQRINYLQVFKNFCDSLEFSKQDSLAIMNFTHSLKKKSAILGKINNYLAGINQSFQDGTCSFYLSYNQIKLQEISLNDLLKFYLVLKNPDNLSNFQLPQIVAKDSLKYLYDQNFMPSNTYLFNLIPKSKNNLFKNMIIPVLPLIITSNSSDNKNNFIHHSYLAKRDSTFALEQDFLRDFLISDSIINKELQFDSLSILQRKTLTYAKKISFGKENYEELTLSNLFAVKEMLADLKIKTKFGENEGKIPFYIEVFTGRKLYYLNLIPACDSYTNYNINSLISFYERGIFNLYIKEKARNKFQIIPSRGGEDAKTK